MSSSATVRERACREASHSGGRSASAMSVPLVAGSIRHVSTAHGIPARSCIQCYARIA